MPLFRSLPSLLLDRPGEDRASAVVIAATSEIAQRYEPGTPATGTILARLMEVLLVEMLRRYGARQQCGTEPGIATLCDPVVGRAMQVIHRDPSHRWTVGALAREAGTSRSVLSERFSALAGQPPIDYLAHYRIARAAERLRLSDDCNAAVACDSGIESEAAFHRAFKRIKGVAPGRWREKTAQPRQDETQASEAG